MNPILTIERLRELLSYDSVTGIFTNLVDRRRCGKSGDTAGSINGRLGYVQIGIDGRRYYAHRLAWFYMTGEWPDQIDHIDRNRAHNAWSNLRECSNSQNQANRRATSSEGLKGVTWHDCGKWMAQINVSSRHIYLGLFDSAIAAHTAYCIAAREHFGEFAHFGENSPQRHFI